MDADHPHGPEVPDYHGDRQIVHRQVVGLEDFTESQRQTSMKDRNQRPSEEDPGTHPRYMTLNQKSSMRDERMSQPWMNCKRQRGGHTPFHTTDL